MVLRLSSGLVSANRTENIVCVELLDPDYSDDKSIDPQASINVRVSFLDCEKQLPTVIYALQNSGKVINFVDTEEELDYDTATAATFEVWETVDAGSTQLITKSIGSGVTVVNGNTLRVTLEDSDMTISAGRHWWELWVTIDGDNKIVSRGDFMCQDTRKYD